MLAKNMKPAISKILVHEGGYVNHPKDPGGATNLGVTQRVYDAYRKRMKAKTHSVKHITKAEAIEIYDRQYWDAVQGDKLPSGVDYVVADGAVNSGPSQSIKWLQRALQPHYKGSIDGVIGMATLQAIDNMANDDLLVARICDRRMIFLKALKHWKTFGKGWTARVAGVRATGQAWATGANAPHVDFAEFGNEKAMVSDAKPSPAKGAADAATGGGVASGGVAGTVQGLQDQLTPLSSAGDWIGTVVVVLGIASAVLVIGGIAYRWYASKKQRELADALDLPLATTV